LRNAALLLFALAFAFFFSSFARRVISSSEYMVPRQFFAWQWNLPVGVAILLAAVFGGLLTVAAGTARIIQLRRAAKRNLKAGL